MAPEMNEPDMNTISPLRGKRASSQAGFTLLEMIIVILILLILVVILIVAIMSIWTESKKDETQTNMTAMMQGINSLNQSGRMQLLVDMKKLESFAGSTFISEVGANTTLDSMYKAAGGDYTSTLSRDHKRMAHILCFVLVQPAEDMQRAGDAAGRARGDNPPLQESNSMRFIQYENPEKRAQAGFGYVVDAWENPIRYRLDVEAATADGEYPPLILESAGEDKIMGNDDDILLVQGGGKSYSRAEYNLTRKRTQ